MTVSAHQGGARSFCSLEGISGMSRAPCGVPLPLPAASVALGWLPTALHPRAAGTPLPTHNIFAKRHKAKLPLCHVAARAISWPEPPFHMAGQHVSCSCPKARAGCQAGNRDLPAGAVLSVTCSRAVMFCLCLLLLWLRRGLGTGNRQHN